MEQHITLNITAKNNYLEVIKEHFPQCFDRFGNFDIEKFKKELQPQEVDFSKESYSLDWLGKSYARLLAMDAATTLLKEDKEWNNKEENKNSQNLLIRGDNLEVLKHLSNAYYKKIKMIYIDPPYNTGDDGFIYQDNRKFTVEEFSKLSGVDEEKAKRILDFVNSKSNSHSAWLTFMYPRLYIARQLLRDDGVIFISIDENEVAQLKILMDEIFGEENFVASISNITGATQNGEGVKFQKNKEECLVYAKNEEKFFPNRVDKAEESLRNLNDAPTPLITRPEMGYSIYYNEEKNDIIPIIDYDKDKIELNKEELVYTDNEELIKNGYVPIRPGYKNNQLHRWRWGIETFKKRINEIVIKKDNDKYRVYFKQSGFNPPKNVFNFTVGTNELKELFDNIKIFDFPKNTKMLKYILMIGTEKNDLILDFFAGSGTTGEAVMQLNAEDGGNRKYILVQLPEPIDPKKNKTAYDFVRNELGVENPTIFEITKERLIRAAKKIREEIIEKKITEKEKEKDEIELRLDIENKEEEISNLQEEIKLLKSQDLGFKIFETIPIWEDYDIKAESFKEQITFFDVDKLKEEDIQVLLTTWKTYDGVPLTEDLKTIDLDGYIGYYYDTKLYLMNRGFETKHLKKLLEEIDENKEFNPATIVIFGYNFESKTMREIKENVSSYANKKSVNIDVIIRY